MAIERELKFAASDLGLVRDRLKDIGAIFIDKYFEQNIVFDRPDKSLKERRILLRLRKIKNRNILCLKCPHNGQRSSQIKILDEYETEISNRENFIAILNKLGFDISFQYEKIREKWRFEDLIICLDILPFGEYVEIEGDGDLFGFAQKLGLREKDATSKNYHELNSEIRKKKGLAPCDSFVFKDWVS